MLVWSAESPESNWSATVLGKPALKLRLSGVVGEAIHVENFASFRKESTYVCSGIHRAGQNVRMILRRLGFADESTKNAS